MPARPSWPISNFSPPVEPTTCSGGMPYVFSVQARMKSAPPPETMKVLKPFAREISRAAPASAGRPDRCKACRGADGSDGKPSEHGLVILFRHKAGLRCGDKLKKALGAGRRQRRHVVIDCGFEWPFLSQFRMLRRHRAYAVEREDDLKVNRSLGPQRAVVVEGGNASLPARNLPRRVL